MRGGEWEEKGPGEHRMEEGAEILRYSMLWQPLMTKFIFANFTSSCGSQCGSFSSETDFRNTENPKRSGWTNYIRFANIIIKPYKIKI